MLAPRALFLLIAWTMNLGCLAAPVSLPDSASKDEWTQPSQPSGRRVEASNNHAREVIHKWTDEEIASAIPRNMKVHDCAEGGPPTLLCLPSLCRPSWGNRDCVPCNPNRVWVRSCLPTKTPTSTPSASPSDAPTSEPTNAATNAPTASQSETPTSEPTSAPTKTPTSTPSASPSDAPTSEPTSAPSSEPSSMLSSMPSAEPSSQPSSAPSDAPTNSCENTLDPNKCKKCKPLHKKCKKCEKSNLRKCKNACKYTYLPIYDGGGG